VPVLAITGQRRLPADQLQAAGIASVYPLTDVEPDLQVCIANPGPLLERLVRQTSTEWLGVKSLS
jgi:glycerate kinase